MTVPAPMTAPPRNRGRRALFIALGCVCALVIALVLATVVLWNIPQAGVADETPVAPAASDPGDDLRHAFLSLGHTSATQAPPVAAPAVVEQRVPFRMTVSAVRYRIVIGNVDYLADTDAAGSVTVDSVYLGTDAGEGRFGETPVRLSDPVTLTGGDELTTDWFGPETLPLDAGEDLQLGIVFSAAGDATVGVNPAVGWVRAGASRGAMTADADPGTYTRAGTYLDIRIEYAFDDPDRRIPVVAVIGHSLNTGANQNPDVPHEGEKSSWHQLWADQYGGAAASLAAAGAWTPNFAPTSPKWALAGDVDADIVTIWSSSSDLVAGTAPDRVGWFWEQVVDQARRSWPHAKIVAFTEPPRGASGEGEEYRRQWNAFLREGVDGIDGVVDVDAAVADPADPMRLAPEYDGDGSHMSPVGNDVVARLFAAEVSNLTDTANPQ